MTDVGPVEFAKAMADKTRQQIMRACCCQWVSVGDLAAQADVSQPTVSHHLAILREADLVRVRHEASRVFTRSTRTVWWPAAARSCWSLRPSSRPAPPPRPSAPGKQCRKITRVFFCRYA